jgi:CheY-like chemotaxis protein
MPTILIVEDDAPTAFIQKAVLEGLGLAVSIVDRGALAIQTMKDQKPDVVVLDLIMPFRSGIEILSEMAEDPYLQSLPVIACSGSVDDQDDAYREFRKRFVELRKEEPVVVNKIPRPKENRIELPHAVALLLEKKGVPLPTELAAWKKLNVG